MTSLSLIVRGDDFGLCHAANQALCEALETGLLTCASIRTTTPWLAEAVSLARTHAEWELGLQLALRCPTPGYRWGPILGAAAVPSLVDDLGYFPPMPAATARPDEMGRELEAQAERGLRAGIHPAYLEYDGPEHPDVMAALRGLSERLGVPARMTACGVQPLSLPEPSPQALAEALAQLQPGVYLWLTHPLHDAPETWALGYAPELLAQRHAESAALGSPEVRTLLDQQAVERISFRQHLEQRLGTDVEAE